MEDKKATVFLTGGTGVMGQAVVEELSHHLDKINLRLLVHERKMPSVISTIINQNKETIQTIQGDLKDYNTILKCITGADYVLHVGGMVSPYADAFPYETLDVNIGGMKNIIKAVLAQKNKDDIKVVYIGSVAETGNRNYPLHYGRTGDPINISIYDHYALSKAIAEMLLIDSGIKNWVSLRMTGIIHAGLFNNMKPIVMHIVINGGLEWCTQEDSGRVLRQLVLLDLEGKLGKDFWNHIFNVSSGKEYQLSNYDFENYILKGSKLPETKLLFEPNWFVTKNFHGHFYLDSDKLENFLHFRENRDLKTYFEQLSCKAPFLVKMGKFATTGMIKYFMKKLANTKGDGTLDWIKKNNEPKIKAYFGSMDEYKKIPAKWEDYKFIELHTDNPKLLDHGYDTNKPESEIDIEDVKSAAKFRGGELLSDKMEMWLL